MQIIAFDAQQYSIQDLLLFHTDWTAVIFERFLENTHNTLFILIDNINNNNNNNNKIIGFLAINQIVDQIEIENIAILASHQRQGFAQQLIDFLLVYSQHNKCIFIDLEVNEQNIPAQHLYLKNGFQIVGRRKKYYHGKTDALLMRLYFI